MVLPESITNLGYASFRACRRLKKLTLKATSLGYQDDLFSGCDSLTELIVDCGKVIGGGDKFLTGASLKTVRLINSAIIEDSDIPLSRIENVYTDNLSLWCENMSMLNRNKSSQLYVNDSVPDVLAIPDGVAKVTDYAFVYQPYSNIVIPSTVASIGSYAMSDVKSVTCLAITPPTIVSSTFARVDKSTAVLTVPVNCGETYRSAQYWNEFENIVESTSGEDVDSSNTAIDSAIIGASNVYTANSTVYVEHVASGTPVSVYRIDGLQLFATESDGSAIACRVPAPGIYVVCIGCRSYKVVM